MRRTKSKEDLALLNWAEQSARNPPKFQGRLVYDNDGPPASLATAWRAWSHGTRVRVVVVSALLALWAAWIAFGMWVLE